MRHKRRKIVGVCDYGVVTYYDIEGFVGRDYEIVCDGDKRKVFIIREE